MIWQTLRLSLLVGFLATFLIGLIGTALGFLLARRNFRGKDVLDAFVTLPMILPPTVTGYYLILILGKNGFLGKPLFELTGLSIPFTWPAAVVAATVIALPLMIKSARAAIESVNIEYETASRIMGKSEWETFFRITLPLAGKGLLAGIVLSFARAFGEFGATLMLAGSIPGETQTMPLKIWEAFVSGEDDLAKWLALIMTCISVTVIYLTNRLSRPNKSV